MDLVEVEIVVQTITAQYGTLNVGDKLHTTEKFAEHLVDDCKAARYLNEAVQTSAQAATDEFAAGLQPRQENVPGKKARKRNGVDAVAEGG